jgi:tRNA threonylcarbamoyladenosine biosynthesis protein TsaB
MRVLGLDTTVSGCHVALLENGHVLTQASDSRPRGQAEVLVPFLQDILARQSLCFQDLDLFGITTGPGAFTSIRIGLATVHGIMLGTGIPAVGMTTLRALALSALEEHEAATGNIILAAIKGQQERCFVQTFTKESINTLEEMESPHEVQDLVTHIREFTKTHAHQKVFICGTGMELLSDIYNAEVCKTTCFLPNAAVVARYAHMQYDHAPEPESFKTWPQPFYLRDADVSITKKI